MANVLFVSGSPTFGAQFTQTAPAGYSYLQANDTTTAFSRFQTGNYDAVFVYCETATGTMGQFNVAQFITQVRNTTGITNTPIFLVVPTNASAEGVNWQNNFGADGFIAWEGTGNTGFWNQVREVLTQFNIRAA